MTAGHFGLAAAVKSPAPRIPLWALLLATYLLDILFIILNGFGVESFAPMDPAHPAYGETLIQAYYSHSLVGAALIAAAAALVARRAWGQQGEVVIGAVVFSHWILDLIVHRPDLPILPGNAGNLPLLGFGLWQLPWVSAAVELVLVIAGVYFYYQSTLRLAATASRGRGEQRSRGLVTAAVTGLLLLLLLLSDLFSLLLLSVLLMLLLIVLCGWLDSRLNWSAVV